MSSTPTPAPRRWWSLAATCTAAGLVWLAFADLGVAIPTIADDTGATMSALQWANNAFSLVTGALVIATGKFADVFGRRRVLAAGLIVFTLASAFAALAPGVNGLILGRALMGVGAAAILPATLAVIPAQFTGREQLAAFGIWQAVAWGGQAVGPAVGGVITSTLGWSWLFWVNLPLAAVALAVMQAVTPESSAPGASRAVDWWGLATIGLAVFCLLYALTDGPAKGWGSPLIISLFAAVVVLAVGWFFIERRARHPLVDLRLFGLRPYDGALAANTVMNLAFAGLSYLLVLWLQNVRGFSPVEAGLLMLPSTLGIFVFIPFGGRLNATRGARPPVIAGLVTLTTGLVSLCFLAADSPLWVLAVSLVVIGSGLGLLSTPISNTAVGQVPQDLAGSAAGVFKMSSMVGGALGVAILSAVARSSTQRNAVEAARQAGLTDQNIDQTRAALVNSASFADALKELPAHLRAAVSDAAAIAFSTGIARAMIAAAVICAVAIVVVIFLWPTSARKGHTTPSPTKGDRSAK